MKNKPLRIGLFGASGRLGQAIAELLLIDPRFSLTAALTHSRSFHLGTDIGILLHQKPLGLSLTDQLQTKIDLLIDVSLPEGISERLPLASTHKLPLVIGTTGLSKSDFQLLQQFSSQIPIFYSANFSIGIALLHKFARAMSRFFPAHVDLIEKHHSQKKDAPSGTALSLAKTVEEASATPVKIHSLRSGQIMGEHTLLFNTSEELLTLTHEVHSRKAFAKGALEAALFLKSQKPSLYGMDDLF